MRELALIEVQEVGGGKDCVYASETYSKGATLKLASGQTLTCTGDSEGTWK